MSEGAGFEVHDLGAGVPPEECVEAARSHKADIVELSARLTVTMPAMKTTVEAFSQAGLRDSVKIIVGGAPVTPHFPEIGADGYSEPASAAIGLARSLVRRN